MRFPVLKTLIVLVLAAAIIGLTMSTAIRRGLDHAVAVSQDEQTAIAISLSKSVYGIPFGYLGLKQVYDALHEHWNRGAAGWHDLARLRVNHQDADLLNAGIRAASSLGTPAPGFVSDGRLLSMNSRDIGQVDYTTIAFKLFGPQIESLFYLYFAIVALSALVFVVTFRDNVYALAVLLATLAAYFIEIHLAAFDPVGMPSQFGMKHGSTMAFVAMWHFVFLLMLKRRLTLWDLLAAAVQLAILVLAWRIRGTTAWMVAFIVVLAMAAARSHLRLRPLTRLRLRRSHLRQDARNLRRSVAVAAKSMVPFAEATLRWPVVMLAIGLMANALYTRAALHPVYFTDDVMPGPGIWSEAYMGLAKYDPELLRPRVTAAAKLRGVTEELRWWGARDYMDRVRLARWDGKADLALPAPGLRSEWPAVGIRVPFEERMAQGAFMDTVKSNPLRVLRIYVVRKTRDVIVTVKKPFTYARKTGVFLLASFAVAVAVAGLAKAYGGRDDLGGPRDVIRLMGVAILFALMPSFWSYPTQASMADSVLLLAGFLPIALGMGVLLALRARATAEE